MSRTHGPRDARQDVKFYVGVGLGVAAVAAVVLLRGQKSSHAADGTTGSSNSEVVAWCAEGLDPIAGGGCFASPPARPGEPIPLVVYLHGRYPASGASEELERQARVARIGKARGFATLAMRGMQGQCSDPKLAEWWCWPSNERNAADGPAFVARWSTSLEVAEERVGKGPRLLLGFSNGAYFASLIATRALYPFEAVVVAHGGPVAPTRAQGSTPPMLLITADDDASNEEMQRLSMDLVRENWPAQIITREAGRGHSLPDWDVEMAMTFFSRRNERMPLDPPLSSRGARRIDSPPADPRSPPEEATPTDGDAGSTPGTEARETREPRSIEGNDESTGKTPADRSDDAGAESPEARNTDSTGDAGP